MSQNTTAKDLHEGFALDLIEQISIQCKFGYEIEVTEIEYGKEDQKTKKWTGIVGKIVKKVKKFKMIITIF